jgi:hypothetical protein
VRRLLAVVAGTPAAICVVARIVAQLCAGLTEAWPSNAGTSRSLSISVEPQSCCSHNLAAAVVGLSLQASLDMSFALLARRLHRSEPGSRPPSPRIADAPPPSHFDLNPLRDAFQCAVRRLRSHRRNPTQNGAAAKRVAPSERCARRVGCPFEFWPRLSILSSFLMARLIAVLHAGAHVMSRMPK